MHDTRFLPPRDWIPRIAPTQYDEHGVMLRGVVHDPTARRMGGVAGHAGLFSTADDLAIFAQELLSGSKILSRLSIEKMTTPQQPAWAASLRGLGWDIDSPFSTNRGVLLSGGRIRAYRLYWHFALDRSGDRYLHHHSHQSVHPRGGHSIVSLRSRIATAVAQSLDLTASETERLRLARITGYNESLMAQRRVTTRNGDVKNGIDVLEADRFPRTSSGLGSSGSSRVGGQPDCNRCARPAHRRYAGPHSGNPAGRDLQPGAWHRRQPRHHRHRQLDRMPPRAHQSTASTATPTQAGDPSQEEMAGLDVIVYDIQDVGVRFYTYESTLGYFLEAAAAANKEMVVLDRPDPIGGEYVQGPVADPGREAFVSYGQTPVRHGMTVGELARMFNDERGIGAKLTVVQMEGWMRGDWYDSTGRIWIDPSPNMRSLTEATLYPGIGMIEGTNISVGRGTDTPFELVGAPWIDAAALAGLSQRARDRRGPVRSRRLSRPMRLSFQASSAVGSTSSSPIARLSTAPELGLEIAAALHHLYPDRIQNRRARRPDAQQGHAGCAHRRRRSTPHRGKLAGCHRALSDAARKVSVVLSR